MPLGKAGQAWPTVCAPRRHVPAKVFSLPGMGCSVVDTLVVAKHLSQLHIGRACRGTYRLY